MTTLLSLLERSAASESFKQAVLAYDRGLRTERVTASGYAPRVKVVRTLMQLLAAEPALRVEEVQVEGQSGCSDFVGQLTVTCADRTVVFAFAWDCRWRAEELGWEDCFGFPDQIRAAREYGWDCFRSWKQVAPSSLLLEGRGGIGLRA